MVQNFDDNRLIFKENIIFFHPIAPGFCGHIAFIMDTKFLNSFWTEISGYSKSSNIVCNCFIKYCGSKCDSLCIAKFLIF